MELVKQRILRDGRALDGGMLLVDAFINHQVDMALMHAVGEAFAAHFACKGVSRVLTIESSGIAPAAMAALALGVPLVIGKKKAARFEDERAFQTTVRSFTKGGTYELTVSRAYLPAGERVLLIDDFLAMGEAALAAKRLVEEARCTLVGVGIVIEKTFQPGRQKLDALGLDVLSLARIAAMSAEGIVFAD